MSVELTVLTPSPPEAFDNSMLSSFQRCPRKAFYQYYLNRAPSGKNWPIQFGNAYHRFREVLERGYIEYCKKQSRPLNEVKDDLFSLAWEACLKYPRDGWEDPPVEDRKSYLHKTRLMLSCERAFENWLEEKALSKIDVLFPEQPFELTLPNGESYTGKMDQVIRWNDDLWVRDFKTTSRMGRTYAKNFDPNNQMTGYVWAAQQLSGEQVQGVMIEVLYNTKRNEAQFHQFLATRTPEQVEEWVEETCYEIETARRYESDEMFPKRTIACNDYGGCFFRDACAKSHWQTRERWLESNTLHSVWDPMNPEQEEGVVD